MWTGGIPRLVPSAHGCGAPVTYETYHNTLNLRRVPRGRCRPCVMAPQLRRWSYTRITKPRSVYYKRTFEFSRHRFSPVTQHPVTTDRTGNKRSWTVVLKVGEYTTDFSVIGYEPQETLADDRPRPPWNTEGGRPELGRRGCVAVLGSTRGGAVVFCTESWPEYRAKSIISKPVKCAHSKRWPGIHLRTNCVPIFNIIQSFTHPRIIDPSTMPNVVNHHPLSLIHI